jgi:hypothetical protein
LRGIDGDREERGGVTDDTEEGVVEENEDDKTVETRVEEEGC